VTNRTTATALIAILLLALALRLAWVAYTDTGIPALSDPQYYHATASNLADGRGYTVAVDQRGFVAGEEGEATAFWAPGYPFALAPLYALFGPDERAAKAFNAIVGALTVVPIFLLGRRLSGERCGLLAAAMFAVGPGLIFWTPALFSEPLFTLGVASTLAVGLWAGDRRSWWAYFATGVVLAATAFVRSQGLVLIVPVLVLALQNRQQTADSSGSIGESRAGWGRRMRPAKILRFTQDDRVQRAAAAVACIVAGMAVLIVPWAVRNQIAMGEPYVINDNLGYNLRLAHAPYSTGTSTPPRDLWDERPGISFRERELWWDEVGASRAWAYARKHPGREVELAAKRVGWLLRSDAAPAMRWSETLGATPIDGPVGGPRDALVLLGDVWWYGLLAMAAASIAVVRRDRMWWALWSALGVWVALHFIFAGEPRYHVPMTSVLCVLAAGVLVGIRRRAQGAAAIGGRD
jgi:hypothetical protein